MTELSNENSSATAVSSASTKTEVIAGKKHGKKAKGAAKTKPTKAAKMKRAKAGKKPATKATTARDGSKTAQVLALLKRKNGATLAEIMKATGWQAHSVRGFISGALGKKMGIKVDSTKRDDGERVYSIVG